MDPTTLLYRLPRTYSPCAVDVICVLILLSPIFYDFGTLLALTTSAGVTGIIVTVVALFEIMALRRWEELIELACGAWAIASPVIFQYGGTLRTVHFVLGGAAIMLAPFELSQDRNRSIRN